MNAHVIQFDRHDPHAGPRGPESAIERRFQRIARELAARWRGPDIDRYLDSLLIDTRGDRIGFPADVLEELMFLAGVRWHLGRRDTGQTPESPKEEFSFCTSALRRCGTSGAWVLT